MDHLLDVPYTGRAGTLGLPLSSVCGLGRRPVNAFGALFNFGKTHSIISRFRLDAVH
jgi:hypothetical protein